MKNSKIVALLALLVPAVSSGVSLAQVAPGSQVASCSQAAPNICVQSHPNVAAKISALLRKYPRGGKALTLAIQTLLQRDPGAISDVVCAATNQANAELALALEQGVVQAQAFLKVADPAAFWTIQCYLDANSANAAVAQILAAEESQGSVGGNGEGGNGNGNSGGNGQGGNGGGNGGGGGGCNNQGGNSQGGGCPVSRS